jgi:hypothetical protein
MSLGHRSDCLVRQRMDSSAVGFSAPPLEHAGQRPSLRHVPAAKSPDRSWPRVGDDIAPDCPDRARAASRPPVQIAKARDRQIRIPCRSGMCARYRPLAKRVEKAATTAVMPTRPRPTQSRSQQNERLPTVRAVRRRRLFTRHDVWPGSFYELAIELGPRSDETACRCLGRVVAAPSPRGSLPRPHARAVGAGNRLAVACGVQRCGDAPLGGSHAPRWSPGRRGQRCSQGGRKRDRLARPLHPARCARDDLRHRVSLRQELVRVG